MATLVLASFALHCAGCNHFLSQFAGPGPRVKGRWTGRLESVTVVDSQGHTFEATALAIEKGPRLPKQYRAAWAETEAARRPLLVQSRMKPLLITDPTELPIGTRVEVPGTMLIESAHAPLPSGLKGGGVPVSRTTVTGEPVGDGPIIILPAEGTTAIRRR